MLQLKNITKRYGKFLAVNDLSFTAEEGKILGIIGPNGAGKSTTIRIVMDVLKPDSGEILLDGKPFCDGDTDLMGYLPEERGLYKKQTVAGMLTYLGELKGMNKSDCDKQIDYWLNKFGLSEWKNSKLENLSKGMSQKIQFISAVMHSPKIIFLDEPFSGLDPVSSDELMKVIKELKDKGLIILFSTHVMETAEIICDHIIMLNHGNKILDGTINDIRSQFGNNMLTLDFNGDYTFLNSIKGIIDVKPRGNQLNITFEKDTDIDNLIVTIVNKAHENGCKISGLKVDNPSLHSIFVSIAGKPASEDIQTTKNL
ncbi:MAG: ATP-binding cassette domain-containing protein [Bacteroidales bacterium]|nr:ATP-binding cassette domain-containing protein [Bacteroidales bacterium]